MPDVLNVESAKPSLTFIKVQNQSLQCKNPNVDLAIRGVEFGESGS